MTGCAVPEGDGLRRCLAAVFPGSIVWRRRPPGPRPPRLGQGSGGGIMLACEHLNKDEMACLVIELWRRTYQERLDELLRLLLQLPLVRPQLLGLLLQPAGLLLLLLQGQLQL